jgi:hypothetical protein
MKYSLSSASEHRAKLPESNLLETVTPEGKIVTLCWGWSVRMPLSAGGTIRFSSTGISDAVV